MTDAEKIATLIMIIKCVDGELSSLGGNFLSKPLDGLVQEVVSGRIPKIAVGNFDVMGDGTFG